MLGTGRGYEQPYEQLYDQGYPSEGRDRWGRGDLSLRCDVDYRSYVRNARLEPACRGC